MRFLPGANGSFWMPERGSTAAPEVDWLFYFILAVAAFFFFLIVTLMTIFAIRYRRRRDVRPGTAPRSHLGLELVWTVIPIVIVAVIFSIGFAGFMRMTGVPEDALEILVTGQKWVWLFTYPNGHVDEELHVPVDEPVRLVMTSQDVIHSLYVPAFRLKRDVIPGRYTESWFRATEPGTYPVYCAEYCGTGHSDMSTGVVVHPPGEYEQWLEAAGDLLAQLSPAEAGERLFAKRGCNQCHSIDGSAGVGPSLLDVYGRNRPLRGGAVVEADENYLRQSILEPAASIVAGFEAYMPTYQGRLKEAEVIALIEYLKRLKTEEPDRES